MVICSASVAWSRCRNGDKPNVRCAGRLVYYLRTGVSVFCLLLKMVTDAGATENLDMGLMNFMKEWFPVETKEKAKSNERESAEEQLAEMGFAPNSCILM